MAERQPSIAQTDRRRRTGERTDPLPDFALVCGEAVPGLAGGGSTVSIRLIASLSADASRGDLVATPGSTDGSAGVNGVDVLGFCGFLGVVGRLSI